MARFGGEAADRGPGPAEAIFSMRARSTVEDFFARGGQGRHELRGTSTRVGLMGAADRSTQRPRGQ